MILQPTARRPRNGSSQIRKVLSKYIMEFISAVSNACMLYLYCSESWPFSLTRSLTRSPILLYPAIWETHKLIDVFYTGDIPTPRSGHAVAHYGKYMFLYGGINFAEEVAYNDLYVLDTGTFKVRNKYRSVYLWLEKPELNIFYSAHHPPTLKLCSTSFKNEEISSNFFLNKILCSVWNVYDD